MNTQDVDVSKAAIQTTFGETEIRIEQHKANSRLVLVCFKPPCGGAGVFMMFNNNKLIADALNDMRLVINEGAHEANKNLTQHFNFHGLMAIGTGEFEPSLELEMIRAAHKTK